MGEMLDGLFGPSFIEARRLAMSVNDWAMNSPNCFDARGAGRLVTKLVTLTADGDPVAVNLFTVTGHIKLFSLFAVFEGVTNVDDIEEVRFDVYDGTVAAVLTLAGGVVCDGVTANSILMKVDDASNALTLMDADQVRIYESSKNDIVQPTSVNAKNGVTTYLRLLYKNADESLNCQVRVYAEYRALCGHTTGLLVPV